MSHPSCPVRVRRQHGFTLLELMIAMTIGLIVSGLIGGIYLGAKKSSRYQDATARLQENARFATDRIARAIRNAGYNGCGAMSRLSNVVTGGTTNWWLDLSAPVKGYKSGSTFPAGIPTTGTANSVAVAGTDAFTTVGVETAGEVSVISHNPATATITTASHGIATGAILVVSDCARTAIFQNTGSATNTVVHSAGGTATPTNCVTGLGASCGATETNYTFKPGSSLMQLEAKAFYVGISSTGNGRSLWTVPLGNTASGNVTTTPTELIGGVDDMQIEYGVALTTTGGAAAGLERQPNRYVGASSVAAADWPNVITMRVSLLLSTLDDNVSSSAQTYTFNNNDTTATDRRVRRSYTSVFNLRNRSQ